MNQNKCKNCKIGKHDQCLYCWLWNGEGNNCDCYDPIHESAGCIIPNHKHY